MIDIRSLWSLARQSFSEWSDDYAPSMGAALAYYTIFSIAPLLIIAIAVAGFFFGAEAARGEIFIQLRGLIGDAGASAIEGMVKSASQTGGGTFAAVAGVVTLLLGATSVFGELQTDLDRIWDSPPPKESGIIGLIRGRLLSFGMVLGLGFLLLVSLILTAALSALGHFWGDALPGGEILLQVVNFVIGFVVITGLFAMIYKLLPRCPIGWKDVWIGAIVTSLLFSLGKLLIGLYLGKSSVTSSFGAAGSLVVVLLWVYYSSQIFLLGAEFTRAYAYRHGTRKAHPKPAPSVSAAKPDEATAPSAAEARPSGIDSPRPGESPAARHGLPAMTRLRLATSIGATIGVAAGAAWNEFRQPSRLARALRRRF